VNCERARELASEALDGVLTTDDDAAYERHLVECPPCRSFHAELKESLLVLGELPTIEVDDTFDADVWRRIRRSEAPADAWGALRAKAAEWAERFRVVAPAWRWSPVGVAAAVLLFFVVSNPSGLRGVAGVAGGDAVGPRADVASPAERVAPAGPSELASASDSRSVSRNATAGEPVGDIPAAIERFLQAQDQAAPGRELNLEGDRESYRRSNYSYPLRRIPDPARVAIPGAVPVTGERPLGPSPAWPGDDPGSPRAPYGGSAVIAF
jgi:anti-sigma factor RsiW